jgi:hypothetical protein
MQKHHKENYTTLFKNYIHSNNDEIEDLSKTVSQEAVKS